MKEVLLSCWCSQLGDTIASFPSMKFLIDNCEYFDHYYLIGNYSELYSIIPFSSNPKVTICSLPYSSNQNINKKLININTSDTNNSYIHLVDRGFSCIITDFKEVSIDSKNYPESIAPSKGNEKYIIINCSCGDHRRKFKDSVLQNVVKYIKSINMIPVFVGTTKSPIPEKPFFINNIDYSQGINYIDKISLTELISIIKGSKIFITPDGGLLHLAGLTNIPIIYSSTIVIPEVIIPIRNNTIGYNCYQIPIETECKYCVTRNNNYYDMKCLNNYKCIEELTSEKIISLISKITSE